MCSKSHLTETSPSVGKEVRAGLQCTVCMHVHMNLILDWKELYSDVCSFGVTLVTFACKSYFNSLSFLLFLCKAVGVIFCGAPLSRAGESTPLPSGSLHLTLTKSWRYSSSFLSYPFLHWLFSFLGHFLI